MESVIKGDLGWTLSTGAKVASRVLFPQPSRVGFSVTRDCNQRCKTCGVWNMNKEHPGWRESEMTLSEIRTFSLNNPGVFWATVTGGEATVRQDLGEVLLALSSTKDMKLINLTTNGQKTQYLEYALKWFFRNTEKDFRLEVSISIEGTEDLHESITGVKGSYSKMLETFSMLKSLEATEKRLLPRLQYTISEYNQGYLRPTLDFIYSKFGIRGPEVVMGTAMNASYFKNVKGTEFEIGKEELNGELKYFLSTFTLRDKLTLQGRANYVCISRMLKDYPAVDLGISYSFLADPQWNIYPTTFQCPHYPIGNLREYNFSLSKLLEAKGKTYKKGNNEVWTQCEAYPALVFQPWRLL